VDRQWNGDVIGSFREPPDALGAGVGSGRPDHSSKLLSNGSVMEPGSGNLPLDVLIVEDDLIIAIDFEDRILSFGALRVRTVGTVAAALAAIAERAPDFALLDVELVRETSFAIAERLDALDIPFAFVTGHGAEIRLPPPFAGRPRLPKPCLSEMLEAALRQRPSG
jgi:CheY-like chemotaxis protein